MTTLESSAIYDAARYATEGPPLEEFARLRAEAPVSKIADHEQPNGLWAVTRLRGRRPRLAAPGAVLVARTHGDALRVRTRTP